MPQHPPEARPAPLARLLPLLQRDLRDALFERLAAKGFADVRPAHNALFPHVPPEGIRLTALAERAGMTKQAMSELVEDLERLGYLQRRPDPSDGRAKLIEFTPRGWKLVRTGLEAFDAIEAELALRIGESRLRTFRKTLELLTDGNARELSSGRAGRRAAG